MSLVCVMLVAERMEEVLRRSEEVLRMLVVAAVGVLVSPLSRARRGARRRGWNIVWVGE